MTSKNVFNKKFDSINVKNSEIFQVLKSEKNTIVYVAKKGWLNNMIWCSEMKRLDQTLRKEKNPPFSGQLFIAQKSPSTAKY